MAVVDLCAELPRRGECAAYVAVPMLDGAVPSEQAWRTAVEAVGRFRGENTPVLVHCAYGHGRSVAVVIGHLVATGQEPDLDAALARVRRVRPAARLTPGQRRAVAAWLAGD
jgi:protein-tyrosine phosphatase